MADRLSLVVLALVAGLGFTLVAPSAEQRLAALETRTIASVVAPVD